MSTAIETVLKSYNQQIRNIFVPQNVQNSHEFDVPGLTTEKAVGNVNGAQLLYVNGGLFADACLERPVMNLTLNPMRALANRIPVIRRNTQKSVYAYLTDIAEPTGALPVAPCDDAQQVGGLSACYIECTKGRISMRSQTLEMDAIIEKLCRGVQDDLYFVGDVRGVSGPVPNGTLENNSIVAQGATRRQIQLIGRAMQREVMKQFWSGDPTNVALNTASGGAKQFYGLSFLVANDYGTVAKPFVTGTSCDRLNSDIKDFENACLGAAASNGFGIFGHMQELEDTLWNKAALHGYANVEWVWVMHPIFWGQLIKFLPCEMLSDGCGAPTLGGAAPANVGQTQVVINDMGAIALRQEMQASMRIQINGRSYQVILDDAMPIVTNAGPPVDYTGDIYFLPMNVEGQPVLFWEAKDYRALTQELAVIPGGLAGLHGWIDGGIKMLTVEHKNWYIEIESKIELCLYLLAPHLAGRITNINACPMQGKFVPDNF